jgi:hypothetical protein
VNPSDELELERFYSYGYRGKTMIAVRAPAATTNDAPDLVGRIMRIDGERYEIVAISRQISGPIAKGEPIGLEVRPAVGQAVR